MANIVEAFPFETSIVPKVNKGAVEKFPWEENEKVISPAKKGVIVRQKADIITGEEYSPTDDKANWDKYNTTGEPLTLFGVPILDWRKQLTTNAEGEKRTEILPAPYGVVGKEADTTIAEEEAKAAGVNDYTGTAFNNYDPVSMADKMKIKYPADQMLNPKKTTAATRMVGGAFLETIKSTVDLAGFLLTLDAKNPLTKPIDDLVKDFDENFPTMPAANNVEKIVQELVPTVIGFVGGAKLGAESLKISREALKDSPEYVKWLAKNYESFIKANKDPVIAQKKLELLTKALVTELSGNVGTSAMSPEDMTSMSGDAIKNLPGLNILSKEHLNSVGIFVDNTAFSAGLFALGKLFGKGNELVSGVLSKLPKAQKEPATILNRLLTTLDSDVTLDTPKEEVARRLAILGEVVMNNKKFGAELLGETVTANLDATTSLMLGAKEYMEKVYADQLEIGNSAIVEPFITKKAQSFIESIASVKQALKNNPAIATSDSNVLSEFGNVLNKTSDTIAEGPLPSNRGELPEIDPSGILKSTTQKKVVGASGQFFGKPVADAMNTVKGGRADMRTGLEAIDDTQSTATLTRLLDDARKQGLIRQNGINDVVEKELPRLYNIDKQKSEDLFNAIPSKEISALDIATAIKSAGDQEGIMKTLNLAPDELDAVGRVGDDYTEDGVLHSPVNDLAKKIENAGLTDLRTLVLNVRPLLAQLKNQVWTGARLNKETGPLDSLIKYIESEANESGDEFGIAMDEYKRFSDKWLNTPALKDFAKSHDAIRETTTSGRDWKDVATYIMNEPAMYEAAMRAYTTSKDALSDVQLKKFLEAINDPEGKNIPALQKAWLGEALNQIKFKPNGQIKSNDIIGAVQPILKNLELSGDKDTIRMFNDVIEKLQLAENGMGDTEAAKLATDRAIDTIISSAKESAAFDFVVTRSETGTIVKDLADMPGVFNSLFASKDALTDIPLLLEKARASGNQLAVDGIKSQFVKYLQRHTGVKKGVGFKVGPQGEPNVVTDLSAGKLYSIFNDDNDTTLPLMAKIFADDPKTGSGVFQLLEIMNAFINGRATKVNPFGSNTAVDSAQMGKLINLGITLGFGVLNPTAAKLRGVSRLLMQDKKAEIQEVVLTMLSELVTNPNYLEETAAQLATDLGKTQWQKEFALANSAMAHGVFNESSVHGTKEEQVNKQTEEALPTN